MSRLNPFLTPTRRPGDTSLPALLSRYTTLAPHLELIQEVEKEFPGFVKKCHSSDVLIAGVVAAAAVHLSLESLAQEDADALLSFVGALTDPSEEEADDEKDVSTSEEEEQERNLPSGRISPPQLLCGSTVISSFVPPVRELPPPVPLENPSSAPPKRTLMTLPSRLTPGVSSQSTV